MHLEIAKCRIPFLGHCVLGLDLWPCLKSTFAEYGYVAYQIKGNEMYDIIQAKSLPLHTPLTPEWGQKVKTVFFLEMVMLHIELKRMTYTICKQ